MQKEQAQRVIKNFIDAAQSIDLEKNNVIAAECHEENNQLRIFVLYEPKPIPK